MQSVLSIIHKIHPGSFPQNTGKRILIQDDFLQYCSMITQKQKYSTFIFFFLLFHAQFLIK